jgi:hypothetical protein
MIRRPGASEQEAARADALSELDVFVERSTNLGTGHLAPSSAQAALGVAIADECPGKESLTAASRASYARSPDQHWRSAVTESDQSRTGWLRRRREKRRDHRREPEDSPERRAELEAERRRNSEAPKPGSQFEKGLIGGGGVP